MISLSLVKMTCHPERSEGPLLTQKFVQGIGVLRFAQDDNPFFDDNLFIDENDLARAYLSISRTFSALSVSVNLTSITSLSVV